MTRRAAPAAAGLRAFFQIEQRILIESGNSQLASRDTFVGLESDLLGRMKMGKFDTVYKEIGDSLSFLGVSSGNFVSEQQRAVQAGLRQQRGAKFPSATREFGPLRVADLSGPAGTSPVFP